MKVHSSVASLILVCLLCACLTASAATVAKPSFGKAHGFYTASFTVKLTTSTAGARIRYTKDGTKPTSTHGTDIASGATVSIATTTPLRAVGYLSGWTTSYPFTQTYIFLSHVLTQTRPSGYPTKWISIYGTKVADYDMDPNIVNHATYSQTILNDLKAIPTVSVVLDRIKLFGTAGGTDGVYTFGGYEGGMNTMEVECSTELIPVGGVGGFQIDCGLKGHTGVPHKRSLRLLFKSNYGGPQTLNYPFYEDAPVNSSANANVFGKLTLRHGNNDSWHAHWLSVPAIVNATYLRDSFVRHSFLTMRGTGGRNMLVHLYLNGMYWGVYDAVERTDARFAAENMGGAKTDWYARNMGGTISGSSARFYSLHSMAQAGGLSDNTKYNNLSQYLNVSHFCGYIIANWFAGTQDWPGNNWYGVNKNSPAQSFMYMSWDSDLCFENASNNGGQLGAWVCPWFYDTSAAAAHYSQSLVCKLWRSIDDNNDFRMLFADRVFRYCYQNGPLTEANSKARWDSLVSNARPAMVGESARWGDCLRTSGGLPDRPRFTINSHWNPAAQRVRDALTGNTGRFVNALRANSPRLYPEFSPPYYSQYGGEVAAGYQLVLSTGASSGTIYYRADGGDPRNSGGALSSSAIRYTGAVTIGTPMTVKARVKRSATWSALGNAAFTTTGETPPAAPSNLAAVTVSTSEIDLTWTDNSDNEDGFRVRRSTDNVTFDEIVVTAANATSYSDTGLTGNTTYYYKVKATGPAGGSGYTSVASATTQGNPPAAPSGLVATALSDTSIGLAWVDNSDDETGFRLRRSLDGVDFDTITPIELGVNVTTYSDTGLTVGTTYYYKVKATGADGGSGYSAVDSATTTGGGTANPTNLAAVGLSSTEVRLTWTDNSGDETGFQVQRSTNDANYVEVVVTAANVTSYDDTGLTVDTLYYYRVKATDAGAGSAYDGPVTITTSDTVPAMPTDLAAEVLSTTQIRLTWTDNSSNELKFKIRRSWDGLDWYALAAVETAPNVTTHTEEGLTPNTTYWYKIKAANAVGESIYSDPIQATTLSAPGSTNTWVAYNDLNWSAGQLDNNITKISAWTTNGHVNTGELRNQADGSLVGVVLTVGSSGSYLSSYATQGTDGNGFTDAADAFGGKVSCVGVISGGDFTFTLTQLDPDRRYDVTLFGNRDAPAYTNRTALVTISDVVDFQNVSSVGTTKSSISMPSDTTECGVGYNSENGDVIRFAEVDPGVDGDLVITLTSVNSGRYLNAIRVTGSGPSEGVVKVAKGSDWKYRKGTAEASTPADAWRMPAYSDADWTVGAAPVGYSLDPVEGPFATELLDMQNNYSCVFLRQTFPIDNAAAIAELKISVDYDDGCIAWINGSEVARVNVSGNAGESIAYDNALAPIASIEAEQWTTTLTGGGLPRLIDGTNVLAVQAFNYLIGSSDLLIDMELIAVQTHLPESDDADADGLPDAWETERVGGGGTEPGADSDGDGPTDLDEFILGTDPIVIDAFDVRAVADGAGVRAEFQTIAPAGTGYAGRTRHYALEQGTMGGVDIVWTPVPGYTDIIGTNQLATYQSSVGPDPILFRVRVWME